MSEVVPTNIQLIFDKPGRKWTFEQRNIVWEWLDTQKKRISSHVTSSIFSVNSKEEVCEVIQGFYAERLDYIIKSYDASKGRGFWNWFVYCFVQYCHDVGITEERRRWIEGQLLEQLIENDEGEPMDIQLLKDDSPSPEERAVFEMQVEELKRTLECLPERDRKLIDLRFEKQMSYQEIANHMSCPVGSVKGWIFRALHQLRAELVVEEGGN